MKKIRNADGSVSADPTAQTFWQKNQKAIIIVGFIALAGLLFLPDHLIKKYVPWVK
jgi:hypothetical protein